MRFLVDLRDLRFPRPNKYVRVLRSILSATHTNDIKPVIVSNDAAFIMSADPALHSKQTDGLDWWHSIASQWPKHLQHSKSALHLLGYYFFFKATGSLSSRSKESLTWHFAYSIELFSTAWRRRISDVLDITSDTKRFAHFQCWLAERGFLPNYGAVAYDSSDKTKAITVGDQDVLVLVGACWHYDFDALGHLKSTHKFKIVCMIYDVLPIDYPSFVTTQQRDDYKKFLCDAARHSDLIVTPNKVAASRLKAFLADQDLRPIQISHVSLVASVLAKSSGELTRRLRDLNLADQNFLLCVSDLRERKHLLWLHALCTKLNKTQPDFPLLVLAGRAVHAGLLSILSDDPEWGRTSIFIEAPLDVELSWLFQRARVCLQPAFEGGLGLAVMEAVSYGKICIAANAPSLIEASGGRAMHLPRDEALWSSAILHALSGDWLNNTETSTSERFLSADIMTQIKRHLAARYDA